MSFTWDSSDPLMICEGETAKSSKALRDYATMGAGRSLAKLSKMYVEVGANEAPTVHLSVLLNWSSSFDWVERVKSWEALEFKAVQEKVREAEVKARIEARERRRALLETFLERLAQGVREMRIDESTLNEFTKAVQVYADQSRIEFGDVAAAKQINMDIDLKTLTEEQLEALANGEPIEHVLGMK